MKRYVVNAYNAHNKKLCETTETDSLGYALLMKENYDTWYIGLITEIIDNIDNKKVEIVNNSKIWSAPFDRY